VNNSVLLCLLLGLWFAIALVRGIAFDSRGGWIPWWKRPALLLAMWATNVVLVAVSGLCIEGMKYSVQVSHGILLIVPCMIIFMFCIIFAFGSIGFGIVMPFIDDSELG